MTQQQINSSLLFLWIITIIGFGFIITELNSQYHYEGETRNRLMDTEEKVRYLESKVSRIDHNFYSKVMTDTESEIVKESLKLAENTIGCDCMFYSFENYGVVFEYPQNVTGDSLYIYVDIDRKLIERNYIPKF